LEARQFNQGPVYTGLIRPLYGMDPLNELKLRYAAKAVDPQRLFLLHPADAMEFITEGRNLGLAFLGVDGFWVASTGAVQPEQEMCNDIAEYHGDDFVGDTMQLIRSYDRPGVLFQVVFQNP
jgi:hypothetical protein